MDDRLLATRTAIYRAKRERDAVAEGMAAKGYVIVSLDRTASSKCPSWK